MSTAALISSSGRVFQPRSTIQSTTAHFLPNEPRRQLGDGHAPSERRVRVLEADDLAVLGDVVGLRLEVVRDDPVARLGHGAGVGGHGENCGGCRRGCRAEDRVVGGGKAGLGGLSTTKQSSLVGGDWR